MLKNLINGILITEDFDSYAPNFEEVGGAYCFWVVCLSVHLFAMLFL